MFGASEEADDTGAGDPPLLPPTQRLEESEIEYVVV